MSRLSRLKTATHGEDGKWAHGEITRLRAELEAAKADYSRLMEKHNALHMSARQHRDDLAAANAEIERLKSRAWGY